MGRLVLPLLDDVQGIDGAAAPCIRARGAGNAAHGSFPTACQVNEVVSHYWGMHSHP